MISSTDHRVTAHTAGSTLMVAGLIGFVAGVGGLGAKLVGLIPRVRIATLTWGAVVAVVGIALFSSGAMRVPRPADLVKETRDHLLALALTGIAWSVALFVEARTEWGWRDAVAAAVAATLICVTMLRVGRLDVRTLVSAALAAKLIAFVSSALFKREQYPFAPFQMYSVAQLDPREVIRYRLVATTAGGDQIDITSILGTATVAKLVSDPDDVAVADAIVLAAGVHEQRRASDLVSVTLVTETWSVVTYPEEPTVERTGAVERMNVDV